MVVVTVVSSFHDAWHAVAFSAGGSLWRGQIKEVYMITRHTSLGTVMFDDHKYVG